MAHPRDNRKQRERRRRKHDRRLAEREAFDVMPEMFAGVVKACETMAAVFRALVDSIIAALRVPCELLLEALQVYVDDPGPTIMVKPVEGA